jgi:two-component system sensor histidine kinase FlrB
VKDEGGGIPDAAALMEAFSLFNEASRELSGAYAALQEEVRRLNAELAEANGRLTDELAAKECMRQRLATLLEMLPGAVLVLDGQGRIIDMNPEAWRILGADLRGQNWREVSAAHLAGGKSEWVLQAANGVELRLTVAVNALPGDSGQIILLQDVTAAHAREESAQRRERLAAMGATMAGLAHQLRTPLAAALLSVSQLRFGAGAERFARQQRRAMERLQHLDATIDAMLRFLRGAEQEAGSVTLQRIFGELRQEFDSLFRQKNVTLILPVLGNELALPGSQAAWVSVIANLLHNALQFSPEGSTVTVDLRGPEDDVIAIVVRDQGPGIATVDQERIFTPFYTTRRDGTGLGLAIARDFVVAMGGSLGVDGEAAAGASLVLQVPIWKAPQALPSGALAEDKERK